MVFGGQITFSIPKNIFRFFFFFRSSEKPPFFGAQNQTSAFSAGVEGEKARKLHSGFNHHTSLWRWKRRGAVAKATPRWDTAGAPRSLHGAVAKTFWNQLGGVSSRRLREALTVPSWSIHAMGSPWRLREGFAASPRALHEDVAGAEGFEKPPRRLRKGFAKASAIPTEASRRLREGATGASIWKRFVR